MLVAWILLATSTLQLREATEQTLPSFGSGPEALVGAWHTAPSARSASPMASFESGLEALVGELLHSHGRARNTIARRIEGSIREQRLGAAMTRWAARPDLVFNTAAAAHQLAHTCDWRLVHRFTLLLARQLSDRSVPARCGGGAAVACIEPSTALGLVRPALLLRLATAVIASAIAEPPLPPSLPPEIAPGSQLHVAYLSSDFREHKAGYLRLSLFDRFDRTQLRISCLCTARTAMSTSADATRAHIAASVSGFVQVGTMPTIQVASLLNILRVHIVVDLNSHNRGGIGVGVAVHRPAAAWLTYPDFPGSFGGGLASLLVADRIVSPPEFRSLYGEPLLLLPGGFFVTDHMRSLGSDAHRRHAPSDLPARCVELRRDIVLDSKKSRCDVGLGERAEDSAEGRPGDALVLASFNQPYKLTLNTLRSWLDLVAARCTRSSQSCDELWLSATESTKRNIERAIDDIDTEITNQCNHTQRGVECERPPLRERVRFLGGGLDRAEHVARMACADVQLDTSAVNGITITADALFAGLPTLSRPTIAFSSRAAASLLVHAGVPELVTRSQVEQHSLINRLSAMPAARREWRARVSLIPKASRVFNSDAWQRDWYSALRLLLDLRLSSKAQPHLIKT